VAGSTYRRLAFAVTLAFGLLMTAPAVSGGLIWDLGIASGFACAVLVVCLFVFPLRADGLPRNRLLASSQHRLLGWLTVATAAIHVLVLLVTQTLIGRYLLPSAPVFMWCGVLALVLAVILVKYAGRWHTELAAAMALILWAHLIGSGQAVTGARRTLVVGLLLGLPIVWFAFRKRTAPSRQKALRYGTGIAALIVVPLLPAPTASRLLLQPVLQPDVAPIIFPHDNHTSVNCVVCHHNYVDHTGVVGCIDCHRSARTDLPQASEATFHTFCRDCHNRLANEGARHGPTRECGECHR
jgi:hypothetical protein